MLERENKRTVESLRQRFEAAPFYKKKYVVMQLEYTVKVKVKAIEMWQGIMQRTSSQQEYSHAVEIIEGLKKGIVLLEELKLELLNWHGK